MSSLGHRAWCSCCKGCCPVQQQALPHTPVVLQQQPVVSSRSAASCQCVMLMHCTVPHCQHGLVAASALQVLPHYATLLAGWHSESDCHLTEAHDGARWMNNKADG